jgi:hypothetical protein
MGFLILGRSGPLETAAIGLETGVKPGASPEQAPAHRRAVGADAVSDQRQNRTDTRHPHTRETYGRRANWRLTQHG